MSLRTNPLYEKVKDRIERLFDVTRRVLADSRLSASEVQEIVRNFLKEANGMVADVDATEGDRQQLFVELCDAAWEDLGKPLHIVANLPLLQDLPVWLKIGLEDKIVDPLLGSIVNFGAGLAYRLLSDQPTAAA